MKCDLCDKNMDRYPYTNVINLAFIVRHNDGNVGCRETVFNHVCDKCSSSMEEAVAETVRGVRDQIRRDVTRLTTGAGI